jgi:hypothetical protein
MTQAASGSGSTPTRQSRLTGAPVQGRDGEKLGKVDAVYFDDDTDAPAWAAVTTGLFGGFVALVPLAQAGWDGDTLTVPFKALKAAPHHDPDAAISPDDEDELRRQYGLADERSATDRRRDRTSTPSEQDLPGTQDRVDDRDEPGPPDEQWHGDPDELGGDREPRRESAGVPRTVEQVTDRARPATSTSITALAPTPDMSKAVTAWFDMAGDLMKLPQQVFARVRSRTSSISSRNSCSYFSVPNPRSRDPFCPGDFTRVWTCRSSGWVAMKASNRNERNGPPLSVTIVISGSRFPSASGSASSRCGRPARRSASARASSTAAMASCWFAVGDTCHPSSYLLQQSRQPASRHVPPVVVSNSVKSSCHTWFGAIGSTANAAFRRAASWRRSRW